tara:strand:- start:1368 stop:2351 length:984 start_codon:yes stop_codon:yes gene_type:complete
MIKSVSLIIPFKSDHSEKEKLFTLLRGISNWEAAPNEILIINTDQKQLSFPNDIELFAEQNNINFCIFHHERLYPGHARNIGICNASNSLLAFLDTSTHPSNDWLSNGLHIINNNNYDGIWGKTYYQAEKFLPKIFRASTYGEKPIKTLPGSILHKNVFKKSGLFVESTRAGEDADFMSRAKLHNIKICESENFLHYDKLDKTSFKEIIKKWYRNHSHAASMPYLRAHKDMYFYGISFLAIIIAFNWNRVFDPTGIENDFFIPNITKISVLIIFLAYLSLRGVVIPMRKGASLKFIFPLNFILISLMSFLLDLTKTIAYGYSKFFKT